MKEGTKFKNLDEKVDNMAENFSKESKFLK
jgi:hypothetical protein